MQGEHLENSPVWRWLNLWLRRRARNEENTRGKINNQPFHPDFLIEGLILEKFHE